MRGREKKRDRERETQREREREKGGGGTRQKQTNRQTALIIETPVAFCLSLSITHAQRHLIAYFIVFFPSTVYF